MIRRDERVSIGCYHGVAKVTSIIRNVKSIEVFFVLDVELAVLGPVGLATIPHSLHPQRMRLLCQNVVHVIVPKPEFTGDVPESTHIIGPSSVNG